MDHPSNQPDTASTTPMAELEVQQSNESLQPQPAQESPTQSPPLPEQEPFPVSIDLDSLEELYAEPPEACSHKILHAIKSCIKWLKNIPFFAIDPTKSFYYYWSFLIYIGVLYNCAMSVIFVFDDPSADFYKYWLMGNIFFDFIFYMDIFLNSKLTGNWANDWTGWPWQFTYKKNPNPIFVPCLMDKVFNHSLQCHIFDELSPKFLHQFNMSYLDDDSPQEDYRMNYVQELVDFWGHEETFIMNCSNFARQYVLSMYWSSLTMTTRGQQPFPTHNSHNSLEIFDTIVGMIIFAVIVSGAENVIMSMNKDRNVSETMQKRVIEFIMYTQKYGSTKNEEEIMTSMPPRLKGELAVHLHMENLKRVELLKNCEPNLLHELVLRLQMHVFSPNDYICRVGDVAKEMFIVKSGVLEVLSEEGRVFSILREGNTFGEQSILKLGSGQKGDRHKRMRALRSVGYSDVYILRQEDALEVLHNYPAVRNQLIEKAQEMLRQRNHELADQEGIQEVHRIDDAQNIEEVLMSIAKVMEACERDIDQLYENFRTSSSAHKRRVTNLETIYKNNRRAIKNDIMNRRLVL
uniref:Cyclic nucleotide-binding domain-containing protein n=1 Tax=Acrobeloides nanus TaxID=290746 RepID=A0A914DS44_9BILA